MHFGYSRAYLLESFFYTSFQSQDIGGFYEEKQSAFKVWNIALESLLDLRKLMFDGCLDFSSAPIRLLFQVLKASAYECDGRPGRFSVKT
jgi:hypothetical protein